MPESGAESAVRPGAPRAEVSPKLPSLWGWQTFLSLGAALGLLAWLASRLDLAAVARDVAASNKLFVVAGLACHYGTYPVRGMRWRHTLGSTPHGTTSGKFGLVVFFYSFVDNLVPGKLGDLYAAHLARINFGVRRSAALGSLFFLRMIDAWTVLLLAALSSWLIFSSSLPAAVVWGLAGGLILAVTATAFLAVFVMLYRSTPRWVPAALREMIGAFRSRMWPSRKEVPAIALHTAAIWMLETLWILCLVRAFGLRFSAAEIVFLAQVSLLASAFPLTPSGAGVVELTLYGCLLLLGVSPAVAASVTVLDRLLDYWLHNGLGVLTWGLRHRIGLRAWREGPGGAPREWVGFRLRRRVDGGSS